PPAVDLEREKRVQAACRTGIQRGWVTAAHDVSDGGVVIALAEMAIVSHSGVEITVNGPIQTRWDEWLFGEGGSRIWVTVAPEFQQEWENYLAASLANEWACWGTTGGSSLVIQLHDKQVVNLPVAALYQAWSESLPRRLAAPPSLSPNP
ncbi:MAG: AIR synthase-related protein, partial [Gloeomargarita sp. DG02_5_bins_242]